MTNRRDFLRNALSATVAGTTLAFPPVIRRALAIPAHRRTHTIADVEHVVILMQENRSFDHYFGTLNGVRGFGDRFPIPVPDAPGITRNTVWFQSTGGAGPGPTVVAPFRLDTQQSFALMRVTGTPHTWPNAQGAWGEGRLNEWPRFKTDRAMGYFTREDIPFQFAMAEAFTLCDAYHCSFHGGTNPNRLFQWTGTNDPLARGNGPALTNDFDNLEHDPAGGYTWVTYAERLQAAGVSWQVYQNMADNFTDNPMAGFRQYRDAVAGVPGSLAALRDRGLTTRDLDLLADDVIHDRLPQVSWIVATEEGSEHPDPSSPAQGAAYTARVLEALTANPAVWSKTVLFVNFDENDGFFDHVPPPAPPSIVALDPLELAGASTVDTAGEYHEIQPPDIDPARTTPLHRPYGLGPRVPMYVISPWSKGGWVSSEVFDHTSVIRFLERRFGVAEPNISAWRRAVCGDMTSAFDFADPDGRRFLDDLPDPTPLAERARALPGTTTPATPAMPVLPEQEMAPRPSRALPYELHVTATVHHGSGSGRPAAIDLRLASTGRAGAVFHVYDREHLDRAPRRFTVESGKHLDGRWLLDGDGGDYDLWVIAPNGFHRHFTGRASAHPADPEIEIAYVRGDLEITLRNGGIEPCELVLVANAYSPGARQAIVVPAGQVRVRHWPLERSARWYDITAEVRGMPGFRRRFAGRVETGRDSLSDPALGGAARGEQT
ncbi:MAG TPA: phospholipase C, phosphocholine-specific [Kofleriaceae bacterium]|nr:phospholipase C, phosphocholine-specific [Kofleriaceae bacterium]